MIGAVSSRIGVLGAVIVDDRLRVPFVSIVRDGFFARSWSRPAGTNLVTSSCNPSVRASDSPRVSPRNTSTSYANRLPLRSISSVSWVRVVVNLVVWALNCESIVCVWVDSSASGTLPLPCTAWVWREGRVALR